MRKYFIWAILLLMATSTFCQQKELSQSLTKTDYLQKSKKQKTAAWSLLGGGFALGVGAIILDVSSDWTKSETPYLVAIYTGCASMIGSIPLFIASARNKRKAMDVSTYFEILQDPLPANIGISVHRTANVSLKFNF
ncbi:MAG: hypothetical protein IPL97_06860 [Niastella sp.]|nr:hypothetical protein [Niastella sp.]